MMLKEVCKTCDKEDVLVNGECVGCHEKRLRENPDYILLSELQRLSDDIKELWLAVESLRKKVG